MRSHVESLWASITMHYPIKLYMATFIALLTKLFGTNYIIYEALVILVAIDLLSGVIATLRRGEQIRSVRLRDTIRKMTLYAFFMAATFQLQRIIPEFTMFEIMAISFLAVTEFISIIENLGAAGLLIPKWLTKKLNRYINTGEFSDPKEQQKTNHKLKSRTHA